jgi:hypothetical protein
MARGGGRVVGNPGRDSESGRGNRFPTWHVARTSQKIPRAQSELEVRKLVLPTDPHQRNGDISRAAPICTSLLGCRKEPLGAVQTWWTAKESSRSHNDGVGGKGGEGGRGEK